MSLIRHVHALNRWEAGRFRPLLLGTRRVGRVPDDFLPALARYPDVFAVEPDAVRIVVEPADPDTLTEALAVAVRGLAADGAIPPLRGEPFDVRSEDDPQVLFRLDRGALPRFGIRAAGAHLNGFVRRPDGLHLWIARRSPQKKLDPNKLDNMVAGGIGAGHDPWSTLVKEAEEEASLPAEIVQQAKAVGIVSYVMGRENGLRDDLLYLYELEMPEDLVPRPNDDEIVDFMLTPVGDVLAMVRDTDLVKFNVNLTLIDFFVRHGLLTPDDPDYVAICRGLRN